MSKSNCKECVTASDSCGWCLQKDFTDPESKRRIEAARCDYMENIEKYCDPAFIFNPSNEEQIVKDDTFKPLDSEGLAVQIKPQQINVKLRPRNYIQNIQFITLSFISLNFQCKKIIA